MLKNKSTLYLIGAIIVVALVAFLTLKKCGRGTTNVETTGGEISTPVTTFKIDSTVVKQQDAVIAQSASTIKSLQDSIERLIITKTKVTPVYIVRYRDTLRIEGEPTIFYQSDPAAVKVQDSLAKIYLSLKDRIIVVPRKFSKDTSEYHISGLVTIEGVRLDTISIYNKTSVIIGTTGKWYQAKTVKTTITQSSPYLTGGSMQSYYFKPKQSVFSIVVGPTALFDGHMRYGVGIVAGYKLY